MPPRLNRVLTLEAPERVPDGAGGFDEVWTPLGTLWAQVIARAGREASGGAMPLSRVSFRILVRASPVGSEARPQANQRFREGQRLFVIQSVAEDDADGHYLVCTALEETVA